jgi:hypothetical protein
MLAKCYPGNLEGRECEEIGVDGRIIASLE